MCVGKIGLEFTKMAKNVRFRDKKIKLKTPIFTHIHPDASLRGTKQPLRDRSPMGSIDLHV